METGSPVMYHGTDEHQHVQEEREKVLRFSSQLTPQEREIFRQCNAESLKYRCLPFATIGIAMTYYAVKKGYLKSNPQYGAAFKMAGAALAGWFIGKISYASACEDKFLQLENSRIADAIRRKRGYKTEEFENEFSYTKPVEDTSLDTSDSFGYHSSAGSLNFDKNIQYSGFDDRERPSTDREFIEVPENTEPYKPVTTYEELRKRNREEYERLHKPYGVRRDPPLPSSGV